VIYWAWNNLLSVLQQASSCAATALKVEFCFDNLQGHIYGQKAESKT